MGCIQEKTPTLNDKSIQGSHGGLQSIKIYYDRLKEDGGGGECSLYQWSLDGHLDFFAFRFQELSGPFTFSVWVFILLVYMDNARFA